MTDKAADVTRSPTISPRDSPRKRMSTASARASTHRASVDDVRHRMKDELHLTKDLIDFDVIKGSAMFHTKPSNYDNRVVKEGFYRALFLPFYASFWQQKPWFYEASTAVYVLHLAACAIFALFPNKMSSFSSFEVAFPILLLVVVSLEYGRVMSTLQPGDLDPNVKIYSPTHKHHRSPSPTRAVTENTATEDNTTALNPEMIESEESDNTDSDNDSESSSSSGDETNPDEAISRESLLAAANTFPDGPMSPLPEGIENFARRRVTVCVWNNGIAEKKSMSVAELRNTMLAKVKATPPRVVYRKIAYLSAAVLSLVPIALRCFVRCQEVECLDEIQDPIDAMHWVLRFLFNNAIVSHYQFHLAAIPVESTIIAVSCMCSTYHLASIIFSALTDAEATYHRRLMYAKCFTALTSARRSRANGLPHFRLKNVVNIKAWISLRGGRTWLKRQPRQRAADEIVSSSFLVNMVLLVIMGIQAVSENTMAGLLIRVVVTMWCLLSSTYMLRFMMLGSNINHKYQNTSLLLTEQMNVYLRLLVKPHKKDKLLVSNNVLKLAAKLLKELNSPNKISGITMNPLLYNMMRVIVLSAFSSTASEFFGFKLKFWKMKHI